MEKSFNRLFLLCVAVLLLSLFMIQTPARAADKHWIGAPGSGYWSNDALWDPVEQPKLPTDNVFLTYPYGGIAPGDRTIYYDPGNPNLAIGNLTIDTDLSYKMALYQGFDANIYNLDAINEIVGAGGAGMHIQESGTNYLSDALTLGQNAGSYGSYSLKNTGTLEVNGNEYIGYGGTGTFNQTGVGYNYIGDALTLGQNAGSNGSYTLSNTGTVWVNGQEYIGYGGTGSFTQSGGVHTIPEDGSIWDNLYLGYQSTGVGTYTLSNGSLEVGDNNYVGYEGQGTFLQTGGTHNVLNHLFLGNQSTGSGTYALEGGSLTVGNNITGGPGYSNLAVDGGTLTVTGGTIDVDTFTIGYRAGTDVTRDLNHSLFISKLATTTSLDNLILGYYGTGTFTQDSGTHSVIETIFLGFNTSGSGSYTLTDGTLSANNARIGFNGIGAFTQYGGVNSVSSDIYMGYSTSGSGSYILSEGTLSANNDKIGNYGTGSFTQNGNRW